MEITLEDFIDNQEFDTNEIVITVKERELPSVVGVIFR